ncbi:MAG: four helix bundle protein [Bacteroidetes bacterium]|nr:MAG: four helix bundle protein [Bacteroidota bacterium]
MFRFENLQIWQDAIVLSDELFDISDIAESKKLYRFAEQLRGAALSISNNIAEGSGSFSDKEFAYFLNVARRSVFECANILIIFNMRGLINEQVKTDLLNRLDILSRKITNFRKALKV